MYMGLPAFARCRVAVGISDSSPPSTVTALDGRQEPNVHGCWIVEGPRMQGQLPMDNDGEVLVHGPKLLVPINGNVVINPNAVIYEIVDISNMQMGKWTVISPVLRYADYKALDRYRVAFTVTHQFQDVIDIPDHRLPPGQIGALRSVIFAPYPPRLGYLTVTAEGETRVYLEPMQRWDIVKKYLIEGAVWVEKGTGRFRPLKAADFHNHAEAIAGHLRL